MINNPGYQGKWKPARIPNPDYFEVIILGPQSLILDPLICHLQDATPWKMTPIGGLGLELWSMSDR